MAVIEGVNWGNWRGKGEWKGYLFFFYFSWKKKWEELGEDKRICLLEDKWDCPGTKVQHSKTPCFILVMNKVFYYVDVKTRIKFLC